MTIFLDGFNEIPREHRDRGTFDADLDAMLVAHPNLSLVIGSRTRDGLERFDLPNYELSDIPGDEVERLITARDCIIPDPYRQEIKNILRRPFYFRMFEQAAISLDDVRSPADLYAQYVGSFGRRFAAEFGGAVDLVDALELQAYRTLELGTETFLLEELDGNLRAVVPAIEGAGTEGNH